MADVVRLRGRKTDTARTHPRPGAQCGCLCRATGKPSRPPGFRNSRVGRPGRRPKSCAAAVVDYKTTRFENTVPPVDAIIDTVGGNTRARSLGIIKPGGVLVTSVSESPPEQHQANGGSRVFFLVEVTTSRLDKIADLFDQSKLIARVGTVLPLEQGRIAHEMLAGAPHKRGKIVLEVGG